MKGEKRFYGLVVVMAGEFDRYVRLLRGWMPEEERQYAQQRKENLEKELYQAKGILAIRW